MSTYEEADWDMLGYGSNGLGVFDGDIDDDVKYSYFSDELDDAYAAQHNPVECVTNPGNNAIELV